MNTNEVNFFLELESSVWAALVAGDMQADESLLADDFLGVYSTGTTGKELHAAQLIDGPTISEYCLSDAQILVLAEGVVLLTYLAHFSRNKKAESTSMKRCISVQSGGKQVKPGSIFSAKTQRLKFNFSVGKSLSGG
jgi:hypothetical protein